MSRNDRVAKCNQLLRIEQLPGKNAAYVHTETRIRRRNSQRQAVGLHSVATGCEWEFCVTDGPGLKVQASNASSARTRPMWQALTIFIGLAESISLFQQPVNREHQCDTSQRHQ